MIAKIDNTSFLTAALVILLAGIQFVGCASAPSLKKTEDMVIKAQETFRVAQGNAKNSTAYTKALEEAEAYLAKAENHWKARRAKWAYDNAVSSFLISKRTLREIYVKDIVPLAEKTLPQIEAKVKSDPENPLKAFIPKLHEVIRLSKQIQSGIEIPEIHDVVEEARATAVNSDLAYRTQQDEELESDVTFSFGKYNLSDSGRQRIRQLVVEGIMGVRDDYIQNHPEQSPNTTINILGYTDEAGFLENGTLFRQLVKGIDTLPEKQPDRRQFLNKRLSMFRAKEIQQYIEKIYLKNAGKAAMEQVLLHTEGRGETYPNSPEQMDPPYRRKDPRRRICKIYFSLTQSK
jgi:outer membrane protein OmpA-like peptidoglycan-associated protein